MALGYFSYILSNILAVGMAKPESKVVQILTIVELKIDGKPLYKIYRPVKSSYLSSGSRNSSPR